MTDPQIITVRMNERLVRTLIAQVQDALGPIHTDQALAHALAALNSTTAAMLAQYAMNEEHGLEMLKQSSDTVASLYRQMRADLSPGMGLEKPQ